MSIEVSKMKRNSSGGDGSVTTRFFLYIFSLLLYKYNSTALSYNGHTSAVNLIQVTKRFISIIFQFSCVCSCFRTHFNTFLNKIVNIAAAIKIKIKSMHTQRQRRREREERERRENNHFIQTQQ